MNCWWNGSPSQAALARALRISKSLIGKYRDRGMPVDSIEAAHAWRSTHVRAMVRSGVAPPDTSGAPAQAGDEAVAPYDESRARREQAEAGLAELQLGEANGSLLARERVELAVFHAGRALRDQLSSCAGSLGAAVAPLSMAGACEAAIRTAHRKLLEDFTHSLAKMLGEPQAAPAPADRPAPAKPVATRTAA